MGLDNRDPSLKMTRVSTTHIYKQTHHPLFPLCPGTVDAARYAEANAFFLKAGLINKPIKTEHSLDASAWK